MTLCNNQHSENDLTLSCKLHQPCTLMISAKISSHSATTLKNCMIVHHQKWIVRICWSRHVTRLLFIFIPDITDFPMENLHFNVLKESQMWFIKVAWSENVWHGHYISEYRVVSSVVVADKKIIYYDFIVFFFPSCVWGLIVVIYCSQ